MKPGCPWFGPLIFHRRKSVAWMNEPDKQNYFLLWLCILSLLKLLFISLGIFLNLLNLNTWQTVFWFNEKTGAIFMSVCSESIAESSTTNSTITGHNFCAHVGIYFTAVLTWKSDGLIRNKNQIRNRGLIFRLTSSLVKCNVFKSLIRIVFNVDFVEVVTQEQV